MPSSPTNFMADMNRDGIVTISDVYLWFGWVWDWPVWVFYFPGNALVEYMLASPADDSLCAWLPRFCHYRTDFARFFEITTDWYGGWFAGFVSASPPSR